MKKHILTLFACLSFFTAIHAQSNGGFEQWDTTFSSTYELELTNLLGPVEPVAGFPYEWTQSDEFGVTRTTDAHSGNYSIVLHNWYYYSNAYIEYKKPVAFTPKYISGYYKYIPRADEGEPAIGLGRVVLFNAQGDTLSDTEFFLDSVSTYQHFQFALNPVSNGAVAEVWVQFKNAVYGLGCWQPSQPICNFLFLDDIQLTETSTTGIEAVSKPSFSVFPNPCVNRLLVKTELSSFQVEIWDSLGTQMLVQKNARVLDVYSLPAGVYTIRILDPKGILLHAEQVIKSH